MELSVIFVNAFPDETVVALVHRLAHSRGLQRATARVDGTGGAPYRVQLHAGARVHRYEHTDAAIAVCGAFQRWETDMFMDDFRDQIAC